MTLIKYADAIVDGTWTPSKKSNLKQAADNLEISSDIPEDFIFDPGKVYSSVRAISARINDNEDGFDREELLGAITDPAGEKFSAHNDQYGYVTFRGKNNHIDHKNEPELASHDPRHAPRGKLLWSWYHEDSMDQPVMRRGTEDPVVKAAGSDSWVRLLIENDRREFPLLCHYIEEGLINKVSMGCEILNSQCSVCGNVAHHAFQYCGHVRQEGRGQVFSAHTESPYTQMGIVEVGDPIVAFERNHGLKFFEESWILETQADPTAVLLDLVRGEPGMSFRELEAAKKKAQKITSLYRNKSAVEAEGNGVNLNINGIDPNKLQTEMDENTEGREMDYNVPPSEQDGKFYPAAPFPCSALSAANEASLQQDPEADEIDPFIDVGKCIGCLYNRADETGAVDCTFPDVVREGGKDPLGTGYQPLDAVDSEEEDESSGFRTEEGEDIDLMPGLGRPPRTDEKESSINDKFPYIEVAPKFAAEMEQMELFQDPEPNETLFDTEDYEGGTWNPGHSVSITIPTANSNGEEIDEGYVKETVRWVRDEMAREFGGTSVQNREGGDFYDNKTDSVISDQNLKIITSNVDNLEPAAEYIEGLANYLHHYMSQSSVEYTIDGKNYYTANDFKKDDVPLQGPKEEDTVQSLQQQVKDLMERLEKLNDKGSDKAARQGKS